jgi:hypothetical protein
MYPIIKLRYCNIATVKAKWFRILSVAVADGWQRMGCASSDVHTNRQLVWHTLDVFATILTV